MAVPVVHIAIRVVVHLMETVVPLEQLADHVQSRLGQRPLAAADFQGSFQQGGALVGIQLPGLGQLNRALGQGGIEGW
ncbi:hypothetical protein D3C81_1379870 [compost metagenome]